MPKQKTSITQIWVYADKSAWITRDHKSRVEDQKKYNHLSDSSLNRLSDLSRKHQVTFNYGARPYKYASICITPN